jgi:predicted permease
MESLLLGAAGGLLGLVLADNGLGLLQLMKNVNLPRLEEISIDGSVMWFAFGASLFSCLVFGLLPALRYSGSQFTPALRMGGGPAGTSRERHRARNLLVVGQISLALVLLITSGLMIRTFHEIRGVEPGFTNAEQVQVFNLAIPSSQVEQAEGVMRMQKEILERLAAIPGVSAAGLTNSLPMDDTKNQNPIFAEHRRDEAGQNPPIRTFKFVSPGLLAATGTRLIAGRDLDWADLHTRRPVALVSENLARELWGSASAALGKRIHEAGAEPRWREVIGVVENVRDDGVLKPSPKTVYWPFSMENFNGTTLNVQRSVAFAVRSPAAGTESFTKQVRQAVASVGSNLPITHTRTLQDVYEGTTAQTSLALVMLAIAGSMALVLCVIGVYGVIAYAVAQRRREVGIRMALGAQATVVKGMFLRQGLVLAAKGVALGLVAATPLSRLMSSLLFGVAPLDPATYAGATAFLLMAALAATYIPARRAASVDPMETLRGE